MAMVKTNQLRGSLWGQPLLSVVQNHLVAYPTPSNLTGMWNFGVLAGLCLVLQIATGIFLAMHYTAHVDLAFQSVQHLMRDVPNGWLLRYLHANGASLFFMVVYAHLFRGLYYTSYAQPRELVWLLGVVILLVMILTAFIGYVLPWGWIFLAPNELSIGTYPNFFQKEAQSICHETHELIIAFFVARIPAFKRVGPHPHNIYSLLMGSLLGDGNAERHGFGTRFQFKYSHQNMEYLMQLHKSFYLQGYCSEKKPIVKAFVGPKGKTYFHVHFQTYTFTSFNPIYEDWYGKESMKRVPPYWQPLLTPRALAVWVMDNGTFTGYGMKLATDVFKEEDVHLLARILHENFNLTVNVHYQTKNWRLYLPKSSMQTLKALIFPYVVSSMQYKLGVQ